MTYEKLHDGLSDMIESGRLTEAMIPDDYRWLVEALAELGSTLKGTHEELLRNERALGHAYP